MPTDHPSAGPQDLELFSCSGGMAEGFRRAGITLAAFDLSADACDSYEANLGHRPIRMDVRDLLRMVRGGWRRGPLRLLVADPPCTPWSRAGSRLGTDDERDMLTDTCELIALLRPRAYLIGNVPGLDDRTNMDVVHRTIGALARHGYCVDEYARLDAADYGVPQHRHRPFWFGHLAGPHLRWPEATHGAPCETPTLPGLPALRSWVTVRQALGHLPAKDLGRHVRLRPKHGNGNYWSEADAPALTILAHESARGGHWLKIDGNRPPHDLDAPMRAITASGGRSGQAKIAVRPHHDVPGPEDVARTITTKQDDGRAIRWPWDCPTTTVVADPRLAPPGTHSREGSWLTDDLAVILSERAAAILQGFPESWVFAGRTKAARWSQIGQAMPPPLAEAVASSVRAQLEATDAI